MAKKVVLQAEGNKMDVLDAAARDRPALQQSQTSRLVLSNINVGRQEHQYSTQNISHGDE